MFTHVELRSNAFPPYDSEEEEINPGIYGKRLAEFLIEGLKQRGEPVAGLVDDDWGWVIRIKHAKFSLWIGVANYAEYPDGFLCIIHPHKEYVRKFFKKICTVDRVSRLSENLDSVLRSNSEIRDIKWRTNEEFMTPCK